MSVMDKASGPPVPRLCECGCGQPTSLATRTGRGLVKGQPTRCISGHYPARQYVARPCQCGCGAQVKAGCRFASGHNPQRTKAEYIEDAVTGCWVWQRAKNDKGYGELRRGGVRMRAHRMMYERMVGPIPEGLYLDHICRNTSCVNPAHLRPATNGQNQQNRDGIQGKGYRGVTFDGARGLWAAQVKLDGRRHHLGRFETEAQAAAVASAWRAEHMPFSPDARVT